MFNPAALLVTAPVFLFSLSLHEFLHAWIADRLGDPTPRYSGRLTVNPIAHYDLIGTTFGLLFRVFGWAKPVPVNAAVFRWPKRDMMLTALGGPAVNVAMALACGAVFKVLQLPSFHPDELGSARPTVELLEKMAAYGVFLNLALALFNLIPLYPLDGHHILRGFLSYRAAAAYDRTKHMGGYVLMGLILLSYSAGISIIDRPLFLVIQAVFSQVEFHRLRVLLSALF